MKKYRENIIKIFPTGSLATSKIFKNFFISKQNIYKDILKNHWQHFLFTYQYNKKKKFFGSFSPLRWKKPQKNFNEQKYSRHMFLQHPKGGTKNKNFFYLKKEKCCHYNYLVLATLGDLIGNTQNLQNGVRQLIKIYTKYLELEKIFQIKVSQNSFFLCWISYLLIEQIYQFIKLTNAFLCKFQLISSLGPVWEKKKKLEIQNNGNFLFFKCQDFLILKWYQNKIHAWCYKVLVKKKETLFNHYSKKISATSYINSILGKYDKLIFYPQDATSNIHQNLTKTKFFDEKRLMPISTLKITENASLEKNLPEVSKELKQKYLRLIKKILQKSKVINQVELIQKLNKIIGNWDTFISNNITKKKAIKLNLIFYKLLWRWGIARHRKEKAKWIKNRYWFDFKNFLFPS
jgi:hypothetical protein